MGVGIGTGGKARAIISFNKDMKIASIKQG